MYTRGEQKAHTWWLPHGGSATSHKFHSLLQEATKQHTTPLKKEHFEDSMFSIAIPQPPPRPFLLPNTTSLPQRSVHFFASAPADAASSPSPSPSPFPDPPLVAVHASTCHGTSAHVRSRRHPHFTAMRDECGVAMFFLRVHHRAIIWSARQPGQLAKTTTTTTVNAPRRARRPLRSRQAAACCGRRAAR